MTLNFTLSRRQLALGVSALLAAPVASLSPDAYARTPEQVVDSKEDPSQAFDSLVQWLSLKSAELDIPGAAVGVVMGEQRFTQAIGVADVETGAAVTTSTRFGIASLSKIFTATALASLARDGAVEFKNPVNEYLPDFRLANSDDSDKVTVSHLLSHAGGWADTLEISPELDLPDWYATLLADLPQVVPVGSDFSYSNSGFMLAGAVIARVTGGTYADALSQAVLEPLGMGQSSFTAKDGPTADLATGHQFLDGALATVPHQDLPPAVYPTAGLLSSVEDMLTFVEAHAAIDTGQLDAEFLASMREPRNTGGSIGPIIVDEIGTGWMLLDIDGETVLMSQGSDSGLASAMIAVPSRQFGMVVLANSDSALMLGNDAALRGLSTFIGLTLPQPEPYALTMEEAAHAEGQFGLPEWMTFTIAPASGSVQVATSEGGYDVPDLSGPLSMVSPTQGYLPYLGSKVWFDLVHGEDGSIQWVRFAGRMVPRIA